MGRANEQINGKIKTNDPAQQLNRDINKTQQPI
jgi:hypothetical protein